MVDALRSTQSIHIMGGKEDDNKGDKNIKNIINIDNNIIINKKIKMIEEKMMDDGDNETMMATTTIMITKK